MVLDRSGLDYQSLPPRLPVCPCARTQGPGAGAEEGSAEERCGGGTPIHNPVPSGPIPGLAAKAGHRGSVVCVQLPSSLGDPPQGHALSLELTLEIASSSLRPSPGPPSGHVSSSNPAPTPVVPV